MNNVNSRNSAFVHALLARIAALEADKAALQKAVREADGLLGIRRLVSVCDIERVVDIVDGIRIFEPDPQINDWRASPVVAEALAKEVKP